jgi:hypothetical protein
MTITVQEFVSGEPLEYRGFDVRRKLRATYQLGVGVVITDQRGAEIGLAAVADNDDAARRVYWNLKRNSGGHR